MNAKSLPIVILATLWSPLGFGDCLDDAAMFADRICGVISRSGSTSRSQVEAEIKAEIQKFAVDVQGQLNAEQIVQQYENVAQDQLQKELQDTRSCRKEMVAVAIQICPPTPASTNTMEIRRQQAVNNVRQMLTHLFNNRYDLADQLVVFPIYVMEGKRTEVYTSTQILSKMVATYRDELRSEDQIAIDVEDDAVQYPTYLSRILGPGHLDQSIFDHANVTKSGFVVVTNLVVNEQKRTVTHFNMDIVGGIMSVRSMMVLDCADDGAC